MAEKQNNLMQFSSADGALLVNGEKLTTEELLSIAVTASKGGKRIVLTNLSTKERKFLERLANIGKGNILFDLY